MINFGSVQRKFKRMPKIMKHHWHQITHRSFLVPIEDAAVLFPKIWDNEISLGKLQWRFGHLYSNETLIFLCALIKAINAKIVFEFGTFTGRTTYNLALNVPEDGVVYTIDLAKDKDYSNIEGRGYGSYTVGECFSTAPDRIKKKIVQYISDSRNFDFSHLKSKVDLVFVDGGHEYNIVMSDSYNALTMVKPGGVIVWDDYSEYWPGVERALDEMGRKYRLYWLRRQGAVVFKNE